jgi:hypothetical protein
MLFQVLLKVSPVDKPGILTSGSVMYVFPLAKLIGRDALPPQSGHSIAGGEQRVVLYPQTNDQGPLFWQLNTPWGGSGIHWTFHKEYTLQYHGPVQTDVCPCTGALEAQ